MKEKTFGNIMLKNRKALLLLALGICAYIIYIVVSVHTEILTSQIERHPEEFNSYDGKYTIQTVVEEDKSVPIHYVNVIVFDNTVGKEVFSIRKEYRVFDFCWVAWEDDNYNFWLESGDLGIFYYEYQEDNTWKKYALVKEEEKYQLQLNGYRKETIDIEYEDLIKRLPDGYEL